jgi:hypothetical protein
VVAARARVRDRVTARFLSQQLDLALAAGAAPEIAPALALRARRLTGLRLRRGLADTYRRLLREARDDPQWPRARIVPCQSRVLAASEELSRLADRLAQPGPVTPQGAAKALLLLRDGTGPLYNARSKDSLRERAGEAAERLGLEPLLT